MQCLTPITLYRGKGKTSRLGKEFAFTDVVPCGKCSACLRRRQQNWIFRLLQEQKVSHNSSFLTLTYADEHLPFTDNGNMNLYVKDHQLFIKRLRKNAKEHFPEEIQAPIRYYSCGEYGDESCRPHYHSIIFNLPNSYIKHPELLAKDWQKGHIYNAVCNVKTITYVSKYINKTQYTSREELDDLDDRKKEFSLMSKGLGQSYLTDNIKTYYNKVLTPYLTIGNGQKASMPRYYKQKIYSTSAQTIINTKTAMYNVENPLFRNEKHRHDFVSDQISKQEKINLLQRKTL